MKRNLSMIEKKFDKLCSFVKQDSRILAVFLFGSATRNEVHKGSDVDICLVMEKGNYTTGELYQKRLSYLKLFDMDIQIFQQLPLYIRIRIIREGKVLFCRNEDRLYEVVFRTIREFSDFEHIYHDYLKEVASVR